MKKLFKMEEIGILLVLLGIIVVFSLLSPRFLTVSNFFNISRQIATLGVTAIGFTFVLISGGIDLSVGFQISLINVITAHLMVHMGVHWGVAILIAVAIGSFIGFINGLIITKTGVLPLIVTLGMMIILNGLSFIISGGLPIFGFPPDFAFLGQGNLLGVPVSLIIMIIAVIAGIFLLNKTYFGRYFYAIGNNEEATKLSGVKTGRIRITVYTLSGFFTSIGGILLLSRLNSAHSSTGAGFEFDVLTACVLGGVSTSGGKGTILGAIIGVIIVGVLNNGLILLNVNEHVQFVIRGVILITAVVYDTMSRRNSLKIKKMKAVGGG